jgi:hypothetical protein
MSLSKPVIATSYGGNTDFMTEANSYLVDYSLTTLKRDIGYYKRTWRWADPSVAHAASLMRHVYEHRDESCARGAQAKLDVTAELAPSEVGARIKQRLREISVVT